MSDLGSGPIDLAHVAPIRLGRLTIDPAHRTIRNGERVAIIEPRVMQVIVAFVEAKGNVLSRDDLIERAWSGRIVGDNAIQRAISRVREIADSIGDGSFAIETIKGVGYQCIAKDSPKALPSAANETPSRLGRRGFVTGAVILGTAAIAPFLPWPRLTGKESLAARLLERAEIARREEQGFSSIEHAISLYRSALDQNPYSGKAWGGLAMAYFQLVQSEKDEKVGVTAQLSLDASARALEIDGDQELANLARIRVVPAFGHWTEQRDKVRKLAAAHGGNWEMPASIADLEGSMGSFSAAIANLRQALKIEPMLPQASGDLFYALWTMGRAIEAESVIEQALQRWPRNWYLWNSKFQFLAHSSRTDEARRFLDSDRNTPAFLDRSAIARRKAWLDAITPGRVGNDERLTEAYVNDCRAHVASVPNAALMLARLNAEQPLFDVLNAFYFGRKGWRTLAPFSRRPTYFLFTPLMDRVRDDVRFQRLAATIGIPVSAT